MGQCSAAERPLTQPPVGHAKRMTPAHAAPCGAAQQLAGRFWTTDRHAVVPLRFAQTGAAAEQFPDGGIPALFEKAARMHPDKDALRVERIGGKYGKAPAGKDTSPCDVHTWTWREYYDEACRAARGFRALGLEDKNAVCVYGFNAPEWFMAAQGASLANGAALGIYPTDKVDNVQYKARHGGCNVAVVETEKHLETFVQAVKDESLGEGYPGIPTLKAIVVWSASGELSDFTHGTQTVRVLTWQQLVTEEYKKLSDEDLGKVRARIENGSLMGYIYTSGTTGKPKAVMVSHDNMLYETACIADVAPEVGMGGQERVISYLPLSHVAGLLLDVIDPIAITANPAKPGWATVTFARPTDLRDMTLAARIQSVKPTIFLGVPRVWEKIRDRMKEAVKENPPSPKTQQRVDGAKHRGAQWAHNMQLGGTGARPGGCIDRFIDGKVYEAVKGKLGLECCKFAITGAAPIDVSCLEFFGQLGININELYGMSECTGATTVCNNVAHVWGSCGFAMAGAEVKVYQAAADGSCDANRKKVEAVPFEPGFASLVKDPQPVPEECQGEVCFRGRHIMMGYMANPDLGEEHCELIRKKTAEAIDGEGWLHSGDKGAMDRLGMVRITGRFKEIIIPAGGENVSPIPVEEAIKKDPVVADLVSNVMMVGDKRKYCVALVSLKVNGATGQDPGGDELTKGAVAAVREAGGAAMTVQQAQDDPKVQEMIARAIMKANKDSKVVPNSAASVKSFTIIPVDFSEAGGELTATLKLKRGVVEAGHASMVGSRDVVDGSDPGMTGALYAGPLIRAAGADCYARYR